MANNSILNSQRHMLHHFKSVFLLFYISGLNFQVFKFNKIINFISKLYCILLIIITVTATLLCCSKNFIIQTWALVEYVLSVIILLIYNSKLTEFSNNLYKIDGSLRINSRIYNSTKKKIFLLVILLWLFRICFTVIYCLCYICFSDIYLYFLSLISPFVLDVSRVWRYILVDMIRHRLHMLRLRLDEMPRCDFYLHISDHKMFKDDKIRFLLNIYKRIADTIDLITPELHASIFASIICSIPKLIVNVYHVLLVIEGQEPLESVGFLMMHSIQVCFFLCSPSIVIEFQVIEVEKIRLCLMHQYMEASDARHKEEIQLFVQYTEIRRLNTKIWRFIPVNIALPIEVINLCGSSIIVVLNFTHLFG